MKLQSSFFLMSKTTILTVNTLLNDRLSSQYLTIAETDFEAKLLSCLSNAIFASCLTLLLLSVKYQS
jgi:hypothetical protein